MKVYTLEEDHCNTTGYCYTVAVFSSREKAEMALRQIKKDEDKLMDCCVEEFKIYEFDLDFVELKTFNGTYNNRDYKLSI